MRTRDLLPAWTGHRPGALPVFCLPHAGAGASALRGLAAAAPEGLDVQPVQLPGRENLAALPSIVDAAELVEVLGTALAPVLHQPYAIFGHSMGALLAADLVLWLRAAGLRAPEFLVVSACAGDGRPDRLARHEFTDDELVAALLELGATTPELLADPDMREFVLSALRNDMRLVRGHTPVVGDLGVPVLAVGGAADPDVPRSALDAWRARTSAPAHVTVLPGGHFAAYERPADVFTEVTRMIDDADAPAQVLLGVLRARLDDPELGPDDEFFAAGGDSLVALQVLSDVKERGLTLSLRDLLTSPSIGDLLDVVVASAEDHQPVHTEPFDGLTDADRAALPAGLADAHPASALQSGLIYLCELSGDPGLYHDLIGLRVTTDFDEARFRSALATVLDRHPVLRASFDLATYSTAVLLVRQRVEAPVVVEHAPDEATATDLVDQWRTRQLAAGLPWDVAPALRVHVVAAPGAFRLTLAIHHAVIDGWSLSRLMVEVLTCYDAELADRAPELPAAPLAGYRDFVALERAAAESPATAAFWRDAADVPALLVPGRPAGVSAEPTARRVVDLDADRLRSTAAAIGVPPKSLALAAHVLALAEATGRDRDVVTGLVVNGRPEYPGSDVLIGLFLNTVPLRVPVVTDDLAELARQVRDLEQGLAEHRRYPLSLIERMLNRPAFDVSFNFTHFHAYDALPGLIRVGAEGWWAHAKASMPLMVDVKIDSPEDGTAVEVEYDPDLVPGALADRYTDALARALAAPAGAPLAARRS